jgi:predicted phosphodiesterase
MRVAALYDIHANFPALEAVLNDVRHADVDRLVIGGDVVPGPMPRETIDCLRALDRPVHFIGGNGDRDVVARRRGIENAAVPERFREVIRWNSEQLTADDEVLLAGWPETLTLDIPPLGDVLFCHATPRNDTEIFTRLTPEDDVKRVLEGVHAPLVVCGHTHMQFDRIVGGVRVVNAGSVGMPFGDAGAYWLLLGPGRGNEPGAVELRRTGYDLNAAAGRIRASAFPLADEFAARNVLQPPSEREMLEAFGRAPLK